MASRTPTVRRPKVPEIRRGDTVVVLAGRDAGKRGVVDRVVRREASPSGTKTVYRRGSAAAGVSVVIDGVNVAKRHTKPRQRSQGGGTSMPKIDPGGILDIAQPIPVSKVMLVCPKCNEPTRVKHATLDNGSRIRVCRNCGEALEVVAT